MASTVLSHNKAPEGAPIAVESEHYWLRSLAIHDVGQKLLGWLNDDEMLTGLNIQNLNFTLDSLRKFVSSFDNKNNYILGIFDKAEETMIGFVTLDVDKANRIGRLTAGLGNKSFWGRDVFYEIGLLIRDYFFSERNIEKLSAHVVEHNRRMIFNFIGSPDYQFELCLQKECLTPDGSRADVLVFSAIKE
ncbi:GNAT family N-acetyltransferase [Microvirga sp. W0021]|uniref:GNAT family N-acetyltransferase n=1 Tax=Hohaiivirga grylli TaxID=3133970 RepID=A0ABV0BGL9_9HYPH